MRHPRSTAWIGAALAATLLLAGCGGGSSDRSSDGAASSGAAATPTSPATSPSTSASSSTASDDITSAAAQQSDSASPAPTSTATGAAFVALPGEQIADTSKAAMLGLTSVRYQGSLTATSSSDTPSDSPSDSSSGDQRITLDVQATADGECTGLLGIQGGKVKVLAVGGKSYFKGDRTFWEAAAGTGGDKILATIGSKWVLDSDQEFGRFCDLGQFLGNLFSSTDDTTYTTGATSSIAGQEAVAVQRMSGTVASTGYVLTGAPHYLSRIERSSGTDTDRLTFSDFDQPLSVQAPPADQVVDPSTLG